MEIHYCIDGAWILEENQGESFIQIIKDAGITNIWLYGYFYGHFWSPLSVMIQAKQILEEKGFQVGVACIPVGHPGNSLNPNDSNIDLHIPSHWRYRMNRNGHPVYFCADIEERMTQDNREAIALLKTAGFSRFMWDDDLRFGNAGQELQGCFCDTCIDEFNRRFNMKVTRDQLKRDIEAKARSCLLSNWAEYICEKLSQFVYSVALEGIQPLLMVMYHGDERHGIDIGKIKSKIPHIRFRVGEEHFNDRRFGSIRGKIEEIMAMQYHLGLMKGIITYSETTSFPVGNLSPQNWILKAKYALALGVDHLFLMCGTSPFPREFWARIKTHLSEFLPLSISQNESPREYPIHVAFGSRSEWQETVEGQQLAHMMGLPATPVRVGESNGGNILFLSHLYAISEEWLKKIPQYQSIFIDKKIPIESQRQIEALANLHPELSIYRYDSIDYCTLPSNPQIQSIYRKVMFKKMNNIRKDLMTLNPTYPLLSKGGLCIVIWLKSAFKCILLNLVDLKNEVSLYFNKKEVGFTLKPLEIRIVPLENW